jgi:hypothetical protein
MLESKMAVQDEALVVTSAITDDDQSYVDWPAILAGTALTTAIFIVLSTFGSAAGLSLTSAYEGEGMSLVWFAIAAGLWLLWTQISSFLAGAYLAGRMRRRQGDATEYESDVRDGSHGLVVWALGTLLAALIAYTGVAGVATVADRTAQAAATVAGGAAREAMEALNPRDLLVDRTLRGGREPATEQTRGEIGRILLSAAGDDGIDDADRQYLTAVVAERGGIPEADAQQRVDQIVAQAQELEAEARAAADRGRRIAMVAAFLTAASLLASAVAAYFGGTLGGNHRDRQTVVSGWYKPW